MTDTIQKQEDEIRKAFKAVFTQLNYIGSAPEINKVLNEEFSALHRTLKQGLFREVIVPLIKMYAADYANKYYDDRNEASCEIASRMRAVLKRDDYLPFI